MFNKKLFAVAVVLSGAWVGLVAGQDQEEVNRALDKAVAGLKRNQNLATGSWGPGQGHVGSTAFCAWTLLEGGVSPKDESMVKAAEFIRKLAPDQEQVYPIAAIIFFLDKLGDPADTPLIEALSAQLLTSLHRPSGSWFYNCEGLKKEEKEKLAERIKEAKTNPPVRKEGVKPQIHPETKKLLTDLSVRMNFVPQGDNSNTQFAVMALWVARRHGMDVDSAIARVDARFRQHPHPKGGWGYNVYHNNLNDHSDHPTPSMTCAGLLAMALGNGVKKKPEDLNKDVFVQKSLKSLAGMMDKYTEKKDTFFASPDGVNGTKNFYFLWSLERIGVIYDLKTVGKHDWYKWGTDFLVHEHKAPGDWSGAYSTLSSDMCFGVLFLKRANLAADLTKTMQLFNPIEKKK